ncbi:MAG: hypothetical protein M3411_07170 [Chloroflexota bacterium]|jgi:hypothetical protein|nr:hypothetical protein [Chloroflexota bacterium]
METYFTQMSTDLESIVRLVKREAAEECLDDHVLAPELDRCVQDAVRELADSRIKTFVPLLALRRVRGCVRVGNCTSNDF